MNYCKSKRGYFYKVVGDKKTRISMEEYNAGCKKLAMKGGLIYDSLKLEDFAYNNKNSSVNDDFPIKVIYRDSLFHRLREKRLIPIEENEIEENEDMVYLFFDVSGDYYNYCFRYYDDDKPNENRKTNPIVLFTLHKNKQIDNIILAKLLLRLAKRRKFNRTSDLYKLYNYLSKKLSTNEENNRIKNILNKVKTVENMKYVPIDL